MEAARGQRRAARDVSSKRVGSRTSRRRACGCRCCTASGSRTVRTRPRCASGCSSSTASRWGPGSDRSRASAGASGSWDTRRANATSSGSSLALDARVGCLTRIAFLGLGRMGAPMARRLVDAGHDVVVWNRTRGEDRGLRAASRRPRRRRPIRPRSSSRCSPTPTALREVVYDTGLDKVMRLDGVFVDMSTVGVRAAKRLHETISRATLDAPVGGGVAQAASGELVVLAGGEPGVRRARRGPCSTCSATSCTAAARGPGRR